MKIIYLSAVLVLAVTAGCAGGRHADIRTSLSDVERAMSRLYPYTTATEPAITIYPPKVFKSPRCNSWSACNSVVLNYTVAVKPQGANNRFISRAFNVDADVLDGGDRILFAFQKTYLDMEPIPLLYQSHSKQLFLNALNRHLLAGEGVSIIHAEQQDDLHRFQTEDLNPVRVKEER